jgi:L,D-peptidoglycan transpeptidase YkuD (ErfK/YbiS/YcfS/YnhG family)
MGFRFRKSFKILPGVRINVSKTGVSTSVGRPGATINFRNGKTKTTLGIPGTGLSYSQTSGANQGAPSDAGSPVYGWIAVIVIVIFIWAIL